MYNSGYLDLSGSPLARRAYLDHRLRVSNVARRPQSATVRPTSLRFQDVHNTPPVSLPITTLVSHHDFCCTVVLALWEEMGICGFQRFDGWQSSSPSVVLACATKGSIIELHRAMRKLSSKLPSSSTTQGFEERYFKDHCRSVVPTARSDVLESIVKWFEAEMNPVDVALTALLTEAEVPQRPDNALQRSQPAPVISSPMVSKHSVQRPYSAGVCRAVKRPLFAMTPEKIDVTQRIDMSLNNRHQASWMDDERLDEVRKLFCEEDESRDVIEALEATMRLRLPKRQHILSTPTLIEMVAPEPVLVTPRQSEPAVVELKVQGEVAINDSQVVFENLVCDPVSATFEEISHLRDSEFTCRKAIVSESRSAGSFLVNSLRIVLEESAVRSELVNDVEPHYRNELTFRINYIYVQLATKEKRVQGRHAAQQQEPIELSTRSISPTKVHPKSQNDAALAIQCAVRRRQAKRLLKRKQMRRSHMEYARKLNEAAIRIQSMFRCCVARRELKKRKVIMSMCAISLEGSFCSNISDHGNLSVEEVSRMVQDARFSAVQEFINASDTIRGSELDQRQKMMLEAGAERSFLLRHYPVSLSSRVITLQQEEFEALVEEEQAAARSLLSWRRGLHNHSPKRTYDDSTSDSCFEAVSVTPPRSTPRRFDEMRLAKHFGERENVLMRELDSRMSLIFEEGMAIREIVSLSGWGSTRMY